MEPQKKNLVRDAEKADYIENETDAHLLVFRETDIREHEKQVMRRLLNELA